MRQIPKHPKHIISMHFRYLVIGILEYTLKTKLYLAQELKISETEDLKKINLEDYKDWE